MEAVEAAALRGAWASYFLMTGQPDEARRYGWEPAAYAPPAVLAVPFVARCAQCLIKPPGDVLPPPGPS